jgi:CRISPR-associated protein Csm5
MNIKIQTLTPVHIGNGTELQGNTEYLYFDKENVIAVLDAEKVLAILHEDNISHWVSSIEKGESIMPLLKQRKPDLIAEDVALKIIPLSIETKKPIRQQMQTANKQALLPGSSLKGAIRTAVFAKALMEKETYATDRRNLGTPDSRGGFRWSDSPLSKILLGSDPNHDIFRLLQVGDAGFTKTEVYQTDVINKYGNSWRIKNEITQFVEAIPKGEETIFRLNYNNTLKMRSQSLFNDNASKLELKTLLPLINAHTKRLVDDEIKYWDGKEGNPDALGNYVEEMQSIASHINSCTQNECVLRLGWGTGFRSMTGDWHGVMTDDDYYPLIQSLRRGYPEDLIFPKTTRFLKDGVPLGFVKMSF